MLTTTASSGWLFSAPGGRSACLTEQAVDWSCTVSAIDLMELMG